MTTICEGVNEMGCIVANTTLNLYYGRLQEIESVGDAGSSTSILDMSMSIPNLSTSIPDLSISNLSPSTS